MTDNQLEIAEVLAELVDRIHGALGAELVAVYHYGSAVTGGFDAGVSDLDLIAITQHDAARIDLARLKAMHGRFVRRHPDWTDRIEVVYVGRNAVASFRSSTERLAVISPGEPLNLRSDRIADWVQNWYLVRETGSVLFGPVPQALIADVSWPEFVDATKKWAIELEGSDLSAFSPGYLAYTVLTACRVERTVVDGIHASKQEAASRSIERHPGSRWLIEAALRCRLARGTVGFDDRETRDAAIAFIGHVAEAIARA